MHKCWFKGGPWWWKLANDGRWWRIEANNRDTNQLQQKENRWLNRKYIKIDQSSILYWWIIRKRYQFLELSILIGCTRLQFSRISPGFGFHNAHSEPVYVQIAVTFLACATYIQYKHEHIYSLENLTWCTDSILMPTNVCSHDTNVHMNMSMHTGWSDALYCVASSNAQL